LGLAAEELIKTSDATTEALIMATSSFGGFDITIDFMASFLIDRQIQC
jgi:hypothetical protein